MRKGIGWIIVFLILPFWVFNQDTLSKINEGNWLKLQVKALDSGSDRNSCLIKLVLGEEIMTREIDKEAYNDTTRISEEVKFSLGDLSEIDSVMISWESGEEQVLINQEVNQTIIIKEAGKSFFRFELIALIIFTVVVLIYYFMKKKETGGPVNLFKIQ